jgi:PAS domain-containing protein
MLEIFFPRRRKDQAASRNFRVSRQGAPVADASGPGKRSTTSPSVEGLHLALLASRSLLVAIKDLDGRYIEVNEAYARVLGSEVSTVCGRLDRDLLTPDVAGELAKRERMAMRGVKIRPELEAFDRESPAYLVERLPLRDARGKLSGVCLVAMPAPTEAERESVTEIPGPAVSEALTANGRSTPEPQLPSAPLPFPIDEPAPAAEISFMPAASYGW